WGTPVAASSRSTPASCPAAATTTRSSIMDSRCAHETTRADYRQDAPRENRARCTCLCALVALCTACTVGVGCAATARLYLSRSVAAERQAGQRQLRLYLQAVQCEHEWQPDRRHDY